MQNLLNRLGNAEFNSPRGFYEGIDGNLIDFGFDEGRLSTLRTVIRYISDVTRKQPEYSIDDLLTEIRGITKVLRKHKTRNPISGD